jgi:hypothetical protein
VQQQAGWFAALADHLLKMVPWFQNYQQVVQLACLSGSPAYVPACSPTVPP